MTSAKNNMTNKPKAANKAAKFFSKFVAKGETNRNRLRIINKYAIAIKQDEPGVGETKKGERNVPPVESNR